MKNGYIETYKQYFRILKYNDDFIITDEHGTTLGQAKTLEGARYKIDTISTPHKNKILDILNSKYIEYIENAKKVENILNQCEFGYNENADKLKEGHFIYNTILENNAKLRKCFSNEQLEFLTNNIQL